MSNVIPIRKIKPEIQNLKTGTPVEIKITFEKDQPSIAITGDVNKSNQQAIIQAIRKTQVKVLLDTLKA